MAAMNSELLVLKKALKALVKQNCAETDVSLAKALAATEARFITP